MLALAVVRAAVYPIRDIRWSLLAVGGTGIALHLVSVMLIIHFGRAMHKRLRMAKGRLCIRCCYSLEGQNAQGRCPECGEPFVISDTIAQWKREGFPVGQ